MADWLKSMQQTYEFYIVDPTTWKDKKQLKTVKSCSINRDSEVDTLGSATIDITESIGECYIRVYLITIQNGVTEKHPLGTFLIQTMPSSFDGIVASVSADAYTPLLELKENPPPLGYSILKGGNVLDYAYRLTREQVRAPVVKTSHTEVLHTDFVSNANDNWLTFIRDLLGYVDYTFVLDELGRILYAPNQDIASLQPVWTYTDDENASILYPEISTSQDLFDIPNIVEVTYSSGSKSYRGIAINDDSNSPVSTVSRGRKITRRIDNPQFTGEPSQVQVQEYAEQMLKQLSTIECTISYKHGYCPVRIGDCVRINCEKAGLKDVKAKVISQTIKCEHGCPVTEKAVFNKELWR